VVRGSLDTIVEAYDQAPTRPSTPATPLRVADRIPSATVEWRWSSDENGTRALSLGS
jgi:hypothetical protein